MFMSVFSLQHHVDVRGMAKGPDWHQQLSIDFNIYLKATASLYTLLFCGAEEAGEEEAEAEEPEEPDDAFGSRRVVVGKLACNIVIAIQLFLVVLSNFASDCFTFCY